MTLKVDDDANIHDLEVDTSQGAQRMEVPCNNNNIEELMYPDRLATDHRICPEVLEPKPVVFCADTVKHVDQGHFGPYCQTC